MIEVHSLPTADTVQATLYRFVDNKATASENVILVRYSRGVQYETGAYGKVLKGQISKSFLESKIEEETLIETSEQWYKIKEVEYKANLGFVPFYQFEIKEIQNPS